MSDYNGIGWAESRQLVAVPMSLLAYTGLSGDLVMEPGPVELSAGSSSDDIRSSATVTVTGQTRTIDGEDRAFLSAATVGSQQLLGPRKPRWGLRGCGLAAKPQVGFGMRANARPARRAGPIRPPSTISPGVGRRRRPIDGR